MTVYDKIKDFLRTPGIEGPAATVGYIPCRPTNYTGHTDPDKYKVFGVSGVTVATGFDLGQKTMRELQNEIRLPSDIIEKLAPYVGLRGRDAILKLHQKPLTLSKNEIEAIDDAFIPFYYNRYVKPTYDKESDVPFEKIPEEAQVVIYSILYQRGPGYVKRMPVCWGCFVDGDWNGAAYELMHGTWADYRLRRKYEGEYLSGKGK